MYGSMRLFCVSVCLFVWLMWLVIIVFIMMILWLVFSKCVRYYYSFQASLLILQTLSSLLCNTVFFFIVHVHVGGRGVRVSRSVDRKVTLPTERVAVFPSFEPNSRYIILRDHVFYLNVV